MRTRLALFTAVTLGFATARMAVAEVAPEDVRRFEQYIRPLLEARCLKCHGEKKQEANLRLDSRAGMLQGGDSGPAIVVGRPHESLLIEAVNYESLEMPPDGQLRAEDRDHLSAWIAGGAVWPEESAQLRDNSGTISAEDREWWAFQPLSQPAVPQDAEDDWSRNPVDRFVRSRMSQAGLQPAPPADEVTLVRRLYFDLIGLPPTPEEVDAFLSDDAPDAWNRLVDKLLSDSRYGEHWARFWLDLVRYAESDGWNQDAYRPHIWRYRDYVVGAFNEDKPYPRFIREQLAGDEMPGDDPTLLAAAGYLRLGIFEYNQRDARTHWNSILDEITDVTSDVFLGMGMACARCHDHKFDPLLQKDYFQLRAFFEPILWQETVAFRTDEQEAAYERQQAAWEEATRDVRARIDAFLKPFEQAQREYVVGKFPLDIQACYFKPPAERTTWEHQMAYLVERQVWEEGGGPLKRLNKEERAQYGRLLEELAAFDHLKPAPAPVVMTIRDAPGEIAPTIMPDGTPGTTVEPGFPAVLANESSSATPAITPTGDSSGRRTALAAWLGRADNPLTARVMVNRIWQQHFGEGLVPTPSDFGHLGQPPTHPKLLEWLSATFIERGWSIKALHRLILTSATWRQSSHHPRAAEYEQRDPAGALLWRARVRRLTAEQIRDAMLTASGEREPALGGPSVDVTSHRRSLYIKIYRNKPEEFLHAFDMANGLKSVAERVPTTTPTQSLLLINGTYALERAKALAERLTCEGYATAADLLTAAFRRTWTHSPSAAELTAALDFVGATADQPPSSIEREQLLDFCHVLLNANQFLYVD